ncbi:MULTISPECIES: hypothetical protein [Maribacter]|uniref:hypothetical protein n=1 Tax=Maribacter TaxID=252356 RepID=UPI000719919F|nr:hypothetical protein [Maribacter dokdonensis]KSA12684.1 hypothetical protein I600_2117 [Maribacter dokdonensis DSW-8]
MKLSQYLFIILSLILVSCTNDKDEIESVYLEYKNALKIDDGQKIVNLLDKSSHVYLKNLHAKIISSDSFEISKIKYIDRFNILSARSLLPNDSLLSLKTIDLFETLFSNGRFEYQKTLFRDYHIMKTSFNGNKGVLTLNNGLKFDFNKENDEWKINYKSINDSKNDVIKETLSFINVNNLQKHNTNAINTVLLREIGNKTTKPFNLLFWPLHNSVDDLYFNYHFSENLECDQNQTWASVNRPRILFFLSDSELDKQFYSTFRESIEFRKFCKNVYSVTALTKDCFAGNTYFKKFNIRTVPRIIVLNEDNEVIQESGGYFITPEMFIQNIDKSGEINYDISKIQKKANAEK